MLIPKPTTQLPELPTPAGHRQLMPAVLEYPVESERIQRAEKRRRIIGFSVAAALHLGLALAWFLTPPLRLKSNPAPERWMPVQSLSTPIMAQPAAAPPVPAASPPSAAPAKSAADRSRR